mgnify:CR=1 FL=1
MQMFRRPIVYVQIAAGTVTGSIAGAPRATTIASTALSHPRTLMGDFAEVEQCLRKMLEQLGLRRWYMAKPIALVHLVPQVEGGYTNVELRAFREAMAAAGAGEVYLLVDHPPLTSDQQTNFKRLLGRHLL